MKKIIILFLYFTIITSCKAQKNIVDLSNQTKTNYLISNIVKTEEVLKEMFKGSFYINIFEVSDSKISVKSTKESEEILSSYLVSCIPDGDYYTSSKLFKIPGLLNPKVKNIIEKKFPSFEILIEHGELQKRKIETFVIEGI